MFFFFIIPSRGSRGHFLCVCRTDEARNVLRRIRGTFDVDDEIEAIKASAEEAERELKV